MKTVSGSVLSSKSISLSKAASILNNFISYENGASHVLSAYLKRTSASVNGLVQFHVDLNCGKSERKRKKTRFEMIDNGNLTDTYKNYEEEQSIRSEEDGGIIEKVRESEIKKKSKKSKRSEFSEVDERESEGHKERKKRKKVEDEVGELNDVEESHSRSKKRKH